MKNGLYLQGNYIAHELRRDNTTYNVVVAVGINTYRVKVEKVPMIKFGDEVTIEIHPSVFEGKIYYSGKIYQKGEAVNG